LRLAIQAGLVPLSVGLLAASAFILTRATDTSATAIAITATTAAIGYFSKVNPLWIFAVAAILGGFGLV
jgi:chromate transporter